MREIKFRMWDKAKKEMLVTDKDMENLTVASNGSVVGHCLLDNEIVCFNCDEFELMQYTGLRDKNSKEIYEGDIVRYSRKIRNKDVFFESKVIWDNGFILEPNKTIMHDHFAIRSSLSRLEVIGNIYEAGEQP